MTLTTKAGEALKTEAKGGLWYTMLQSPVHGRWIPVSERKTYKETNEDLKEWAS